MSFFDDDPRLAGVKDALDRLQLPDDIGELTGFTNTAQPEPLAIDLDLLEALFHMKPEPSELSDLVDQVFDWRLLSSLSREPEVRRLQLQALELVGWCDPGIARYMHSHMLPAPAKSTYLGFEVELDENLPPGTFKIVEANGREHLFRENGELIGSFFGDRFSEPGDDVADAVRYAVAHFEQLEAESSRPTIEIADISHGDALRLIRAHLGYDKAAALRRFFAIKDEARRNYDCSIVFYLDEGHLTFTAPGKDVHITRYREITNADREHSRN